MLVDDLDTVTAWYARLKAHGVPIVGTADHAVSNSVYFKDPEGNTLEIYCDVPTSVYDWRTQGMGFIAHPLNLETEPVPVGG